MAFKCSGCLKIIPNREFLTCSLCDDKYDLDCANVSIQRFLNTMTPDHKNSWKCASCRCKMPKTDNTNTPIRYQMPAPHSHSNLEQNQFDTHASPSSNITMRKKTTKITENDTSLSENDCSILGDTLHPVDTTKNSEQETLNSSILTQIESLLDKKLEDNRLSLLSELKIFITTQITNSIVDTKQEFTRATTTLSEKQANLQFELNKTNKKISILEKENQKLLTELQDIKNMLHTPSNDKSNRHKFVSNDENSKKVVLHGLEEYNWENEHDLFDRVVFIFRDIMNVNIAGYIEDLKWIGRYQNRRPLVIELLSKKMTKNLLANSDYFWNTGLSISEYLDETTIRNRKKLREKLFEARQKGYHAVIKNNKLIINGKEYKESTNCHSDESDLELNKNSQESHQYLAENSTIHEKDKPLDGKSSQNKYKETNLNQDISRHNFRK